MVIYFEWDPSTSASNLTESQMGQLAQVCSLIESANGTALQHASDAAHAVFPDQLIDHPPQYLVWLIGLIFVTMINLCAIVGIGVMRFLTKSVYNQVITFFVGLGVGSLSGSSFYHLLPQAHPSLLDSVDEHGEPDHAYLHMAHFSLLGVYMFFMVDKLIKIILETRKRGRSDAVVEDGAVWKGRRLSSHESGSHSDSGLIPHTHNHEHEHHDELDAVRALVCKEKKAAVQQMQLEDNAEQSMGNQAHGVCVHDHSVEFRAGDSAIAAVAWMIVFGDGFHNLIDGVSIGASFAESIHSGISVCLAVLCEEFPHELGDVAILVASGMTLRQAMLYNLLSALTCYVGFFFGVVIGNVGPDTAKYAFALAGGMFLYISLGCMMPEMKKAMEEALQVSLRQGLYVLFLQSTGLFCGLFLMYFMARYGEDISLS